MNKKEILELTHHAKNALLADLLSVEEVFFLRCKAKSGR